MSARSGVAIVACVVGLTAGCSGSSAPSSPSKGHTHHTGGKRVVHPAVKATLRQRLALAGTFKGETDPNAPTFESAAVYLAADPDHKDAASLRAEGLKAVVIQHIKVPGADDAVRSIQVFGSASSATHDIQRFTKALPPGDKVTTFAVAGVPGATGNDIATSDGTVVGRNVLFSVGPYEYILGLAPATGSTPPSHAEIASVAAKWYAKVKNLR